MPITLVLDNAKYQKCQPVREVAETLGIELLYLPSYSPNLNLIERLWKLVKKPCLYSSILPRLFPVQDSYLGFYRTGAPHT
jgi:transposase